MFAINHAATALVIKKKYPQVPMGWLLVSVQLMELLWVVFNAIGIEYSTTESTVASVLDVHLTHMPYSHSVVSTLILAAVAWLVISQWLKRPTIAVAVSLGIASHLVLDVLTHIQDIAIAPFLAWEKIGLGLYAVPMLAFFVETLYGTACWWIYKGSKSLLLTILVFNLANFSFFSTTIIGPEALLANRPLLLTGIVFIQIVLTLTLVGVLSRRDESFFRSVTVSCAGSAPFGAQAPLCRFRLLTAVGLSAGLQH